MRSAFSVASPRVTALRALNYTPEVEAFRAKADKRTCKRFGDLLASLGLGYGSVFTRIDCHPSHGVELMSQSDMFATEPSGRFIRRDCIPKPEAHMVHWGQVLIAGAGTLGENELYGRSIIADGRLNGRYVGPDAMVMTFRSPGSPESLYAYAFLCSRVGVRCVRATSYGTKVLRLRSEMLSDLPIPFASDEVINRVAKLIQSTILNREAYAEAISSARSIIESLPEVQMAIEMYGGPKARCMSYETTTITTLCAWNYASTGGAIQYLKTKWEKRLSDVVMPGGIFGGSRSQRIPCQYPYGIDYWSQRDVFLMRSVPRRTRHPGIKDDLLFVPRDAILIAANGQLEEGNLFGRVSLAAFGAMSGAITEHIHRVLPKSGQSEALFAYLSTKLGLAFIRSCAVGTSVPKIHIGLLEELPVPDLNDDALSQVGYYVAKAAEARVNATEAETEAIRIIEEEVLPEWLA